MTSLITMNELKQKEHAIIDVRTAEEIEADPIAGGIHIELQSLPSRLDELPKDKLLAFVCAGNVRSAQAVQYLKGIGHDNVIVLDKFSI